MPVILSRFLLLLHPAMRRLEPRWSLKACHPHDRSDSLVCYGRSAVEQESALPVLMMQGWRSNRGKA